MASEKNILKLMCYSRNTLYVWKREKRPIVELIEKYLSDEDIEEFIKIGKINKFELIKDKTEKEVQELISNKHNELINNEINKKLKEIEELKNQRID